MTAQKKRMTQFARHSLFMGLGLCTLVPGTGNASSYTYTGLCGDGLSLVSQAIDAGVFLGKNATTDESNLQAKLAAADAKISLEKYADAIDKLTAISETATALADARKPKLEDATRINNAVIDAIGCVRGLID